MLRGDRTILLVLMLLVTDSLAETGQGRVDEADRLWWQAHELIERARQRYQDELEKRPATDGIGALDAPAVKADRDEAMRVLRDLLKRHPQSPRCAEALYTIGQLQRASGAYDEMLGSLRDVIKRYPMSRESDHALLTIGDYYFDQNRMAPAAKCYQKVIEHAARDLIGYAQYKLAWIEVNVGNYKQAMGLFERVARGSEPARVSGYIMADPPRVDLRCEAVRDLGFCYAEVGKPEAAVRYFGRFEMSSALGIAVFEKLANRYFIMERFPAALIVYRHLLTLTTDAERQTEWRERVRWIEDRLEKQK